MPQCIWHVSDLVPAEAECQTRVHCQTSQGAAKQGDLRASCDCLGKWYSHYRGGRLRQRYVGPHAFGRSRYPGVIHSPMQVKERPFQILARTGRLQHGFFTVEDSFGEVIEVVTKCQQLTPPFLPEFQKYVYWRCRCGY